MQRSHYTHTCKVQQVYLCSIAITKPPRRHEPPTSHSPLTFHKPLISRKLSPQYNNTQQQSAGPAIIQPQDSNIQQRPADPQPVTDDLQSEPSHIKSYNETVVSFVEGPGTGTTHRFWSFTAFPDSLQRIRININKRLESLHEHNSARAESFVPNRTTCLQYFIRNMGNSAWTVKDATLYACKTCANTQHACLILKDSRLCVLPLPPQARPGLLPHDAGYWVADTKNISRKAHTAGVWTKRNS